MTGPLWTLVALAVLLACPCLAQQIEVVDGDTIRLDGVTWRLYGIDAPERGQLCRGDWPAGDEAGRALGRLVIGKTVVCEKIADDGVGRSIGICRAEGADVAAAMVREGWAFAFHRYGFPYLREQLLAWLENAVIHHHGCEKPWEWRARRQTPPPGPAPN